MLCRDELSVTGELFNAKQLRPQGYFSRALTPHAWPCQRDFSAQRLCQHDVIFRSSAMVIPKVILRALLVTSANESSRQRDGRIVRASSSALRGGN
jgi:hypothetical protein